MLGVSLKVEVMVSISMTIQWYKLVTACAIVQAVILHLLSQKDQVQPRHNPCGICN